MTLDQEHSTQRFNNKYSKFDDQTIETYFEASMSTI